MPPSRHEARLPEPILRLVRGYGLRMRRLLTEEVDHEYAIKGSSFSCDDFKSCVGRAFQAMMSVPQPSEERIALCRQQLADGQWRTVDDIIDDLESQDPAGN